MDKEESIPIEGEAYLHEGVVLLVRRIRSHPEEFVFHTNGYHLLERFKTHTKGADLSAIKTAVYDMGLEKMHNDLMEHILNDTLGKIQNSAQTTQSATGTYYSSASQQAANNYSNNQSSASGALNSLGSLLRGTI